MKRLLASRSIKILGLVAVALFAVAAFQSCASAKITAPGVSGGDLADCPSSPNCVSSSASDPDHHIEPFSPSAGQSVDDLALAIAAAVRELPRSTVIEDSKDYMSAEFRSRMFRFVDDLEIHVDREEGLIHVRSAARTGYSDMGVNRKRIESIRARIASTD